MLYVLLNVSKLMVVDCYMIAFGLYLGSDQLRYIYVRYTLDIR